MTGIGLKTTQFFSFLKISTNMVARGIQNFGRNGPWRAGCLSRGLNFYVNLAHTCDKEMLKISGRYLDSCLSNGQITEKMLQPMDPLWTLWPKVSKGGPLATTIFHLIGHYSEMSQDIFLKFSAFVHHMPLLNWQKNFGLCSNQPARYGQYWPKFWMPLGSIFVEIF